MSEELDTGERQQQCNGTSSRSPGNVLTWLRDREYGFYYGRMNSSPNSMSDSLTECSARGWEGLVNELLTLRDGENRDSALWRPLLAAARNGHKRIVQALLDGGAATNAPDDDDIDGWAALVLAASNVHEECIEILAGRNARVREAHGEEGSKCWTALIYAANIDHRGVVNLLLDEGAAIDECDAHGCTALMHAACDGHREIVELLVANGAAIDVRDNAGCTALIHAASAGHREIVNLLVANGASVGEHPLPRHQH